MTLARLVADDVCPIRFSILLPFFFFWLFVVLVMGYIQPFSLRAEMHRDDPAAGGNAPRGELPGDGLGQETAGNPSPVVQAPTRSGRNRGFVLRGLGRQGSY